MGARRYRGPVETVEQASFADMPIRIVCLQCKHFRQMHAYEFVRCHRRAAKTLLRTPVPGFYCKACRRKVTVVIIAPMHLA
jgi:hypothetical protein